MPFEFKSLNGIFFATQRERIPSISIASMLIIGHIVSSLFPSMKTKKLTILKSPKVLFFLVLLSILAGPNLFAQTLDLSLFKSLDFRNIGPAGMSGRVTSIDAVLANPEVIYIGTASGGIWKSENAAISWESIFDKQPLQSIGAVAVTQQNPSIVWAGTGEGNPRNSHNSGAGIYKSIDAGRTWKCMGLENTKTIHRVIVDPNNENIVYVAAMGSIWGSNPERGVFKTINGGESWEKVLFVNDTTGCADLIIDPSNPNKLFAAMWEYHREPWFFTSGGKGSGLYMSLDAGKTWNKQGKANGIPESELGRIGLAISQSSPKVVYALIESKNTALYRSDDGGFNWKKQADKDIGNRPFYYADIFVDPKNENRLYNLWSMVSRSEDGGKTFSTIANWNTVHPDHHAFWIHPANPDFLIDGNDGGMAISKDRGKTWHFVSNLALGQFYHVNYDLETPYNIMGGLQDNGSWIGPSEAWAAGGIRSHHWQEVLYGDGFDVASQPDNPTILYAMSQGGHLNRLSKSTGETVNIRPIHPEGKFLRFNWNAPLAIDPFNSKGLYYGSQFLHYSSDEGNSWSIISPDLTTNDSTKQKQIQSGGLTIDATNAENFTCLLSIAPSPIDKGLIWVGTDDGNLQLTRDGGKSWENIIERLPEAPKGAWIPQIVASSIHASEVFVVINDYRRNNWEPYLYHSRDFGKTWRRLANAKNVNGYCLSIVQDPIEEALLFLGTDLGLYVSVDAGENWTHWNRNFPSVAVSDLKIHPRENDLIAATFGRSIWILDDIRPLRMLAHSGKSLLEKSFFLLPIQDAIAHENTAIRGERFIGADEFEGPNKKRGAIATVYINYSGKKEEVTSENDAEEVEKTENEEELKAPKKVAGSGKGKLRKLSVYILSENGDSIRAYAAKPDTGFVRFSWGFDRDGTYFPKYEKYPRPLYTPGGPNVAPGKYKMVVVFDGIRDSAMFNVLPDPRIEIEANAMQIRETKIREFLQHARAATKAFEQLRDARTMIDRYEQLLENAPDSLRESLKKLGKPVRDSIKSMQEVYLDPEDFKGLQHYLQPLGNRYWEVLSYYDNVYSKPSANADLALKLFKDDAKAIIARINRFLTEDWMKYRKQMEAAQAPLFMDLAPIKIE